MTGPPADGTTTIKSVDTSLDIVEKLTRAGPMTLTELAESFDRSPSNVLAHLRTLQRRGFAVKENGCYRPGLRYYEIGNNIKENYPLYVHGTGPADDLAAETGEYVWLMVAEQGRGYYLYKSAGERAVESGAYTMGSRWHLNASASGKVVLADMDETRLDRVLDTHGLTSMTPNTITDREKLKSELMKIREQGFARDKEEAAVGICGVAAPVNGLDGVIGTVSVSGPASRIKDEYFHDVLPEKVKEVADIIRIKYNGVSAVDR
ncbi:IclR family transcriptional regulator [Natrinema caseinilyticum]|uniref:IclR family transcriptional regulator n=1 Tax=Natrinema caseinilyticum TaxID=2961570 RepID=UPI0020C22944|nr:IclR family transcriptional regulator [Natrinema caseinilyticum]